MHGKCANKWRWLVDAAGGIVKVPSLYPSGSGTRQWTIDPHQQSRQRWTRARVLLWIGFTLETWKIGWTLLALWSHNLTAVELITFLTAKSPMNLTACFLDSTHRGKFWVDSHTFLLTQYNNDWPEWYTTHGVQEGCEKLGPCLSAPANVG